MWFSLSCLGVQVVLDYKILLLMIRCRFTEIDLLFFTLICKGFCLIRYCYSLEVVELLTDNSGVVG